MPKYQYQCNECGQPLEVHQSFTDEALTVCPHCGGKLRKVFNAVGVVFKGSGFYRNDSRSTSNSSDAAKPAAKDSSPATSSSSSSGSDSSAAKSSTPPAQKSGSQKSGSQSSGSKRSGKDSAA